MKHEFLFSRVAAEALKALRKYDQKRIRDAIVDQLSYQPLQEARNRKRLREHGVATWELRVGKYRVFYDVDEEANEVRVVAIGYKEGSKLIILAEEYDL